MSTPARSVYRFMRDLYRYASFSKEAGYSHFRGVYASFEEAVRKAPPGRPVGYDRPELAHEYVRQLLRTTSVRAYDYPVLFWLAGLLTDENCRVFDFGGNVGIHFYLYERYLRYPPGLDWTVCDLPEIARAGEDLARERNRPELRFTCDFTAGSGASIWLASGSLQYVGDFAERLGGLTARPRHLLINRLPLYDGERFVTLQNGGAVFYPQYVFNAAAFTGALCDLGYRLIDVWEDLLDSCVIPFHARRSLAHYRGLYCRLES